MDFSAALEVNAIKMSLLIGIFVGGMTCGVSFLLEEASVTEVRIKGASVFLLKRDLFRGRGLAARDRGVKFDAYRFESINKDLTIDGIDRGDAFASSINAGKVKLESLSRHGGRRKV
jgi:hypothetical protein